MLNNLEKARWNAAQTGIKHLGPILNEIYEAISALEANGKEYRTFMRGLEARIAKLEAQLTGKSICSKIDEEIKNNQT